jgi:hypothetical protein
VKRSEHIQRFQHHQCQRALQDICFLFHGVYWVSNRKYDTCPLGKQQVLSDESRAATVIVRSETGSMTQV